MSLPADFLERLEAVPTDDIVKLLSKEDRPHVGTGWKLKNEVRPVDLYCFLGARFGAPNGIQNFLRKNDSDNLVHWEWFLKYSDQVFVGIQGLSFRTEVWIFGIPADDSDKQEFLNQLKSLFAKHGAAMGKIRKSLEYWTEFVNPYQRLQQAVSALHAELLSLNIDSSGGPIPDIADETDPAATVKAWKEQTEIQNRATGLCFGIRSMLPVMAEAFVNLVLYILMKPDLKRDDRLRENVIRQQIDIRIKSLSHNCFGFKQHIDYTGEACKQYHTLVNNRNDLLHGNVVLDKLRFNEVHFNGTVPVFIQYSSMWDRGLGVMRRSVGLDSVKEELAIVEGLIEYILSCMDDKVRDNIKLMSEKLYLGLRSDNGGVSILFPDWIVDFVAGGEELAKQHQEATEASGKRPEEPNKE